MSDKAARLLSTFFYVGNSPAGPGSLATGVGTLICIALVNHPVIYVLLFVAVTVIGFPASAQMEKILNEKDPSCIVIDEVAGVMLAFFLLPITPVVIVVTFFLFRAFDMFKIYPVNKFEDRGGSAGIMLDDLFAGLYTNIVMHIAIRWAGLV